MKSVLFLYLVVVAVCYLEVTGQPAQTYCGRYLADTLGFWCSERYENKRSGNEVNKYHRYMFGWIPEYRGLDGPRGKRGIIEECCTNPCTFDVLMSYC
ncbi:hypothetical protein K1T71_005878 [Dendrolimus kikuchii]|uniref:Uncharacterized protein n=1 Tax=Dendrolimus kikuchii TaxID=765133 RepID=A0ACC1D2T2_9NEOP|nr:hypothetical protein K1T71_005878 [Dendrolimus kikuchii]